MALKLYNSYKRGKQVFRPIRNKEVSMYNCGPTVYDYVHIGNLRSFLFSDILKRYLIYRGYRVKQIMNITDVGHMTTDSDSGEDKMSLAMKREKKGVKEVALFYEQKFIEDMKLLGVVPAWKYPRATEHVDEMIKLIKVLLKNKYAYQVSDGSVYYDLFRFKKYGELSGNKVDDLLAGARVDVIEEKHNPYDFALWIVNPKHILKWSSPWGVGYPGWHIECSAMAMKYLGETIDIHTGGEDNKFPHHECEIAQSQGASGKQFVNIWMHVKHLLVDDKKMSKSLGNFYTLRDLIKKGYSAREIRYLLISSNYREALNFTFKGLEDAKKALNKIDNFVKEADVNGGNNGEKKFIDKYRKKFIQAMDDDLNISKALAVVFDLIKEMNKKGIKRGVEFFKEVDAVFGLGIDFEKAKVKIPKNIMKLVDGRELARARKDWAAADKLRANIKKRGYIVEDSESGALVKKI